MQLPKTFTKEWLTEEMNALIIFVDVLNNEDKMGVFIFPILQYFKIEYNEKAN